MNSSDLVPEQILCLQLLNYKSSDILKANQAFFDKVMNEQDIAEELFEKAVSVLKKQEKLDIYTLPFNHPQFPDCLIKIGDDCPPLIHLLGDIDLLKRKSVAVIGARKADERGCEAANKWGAEYAKKGYVVVSGLALGCDTAAHLGCLAAKGKTIAIVATGLDITHPKENKFLQELILANGGLLLSEQIIGVKANPTRLIARNRLQAALSEKIVIAQCPMQSGTMHTVRFALKYKKEIYAARLNSYDMNSFGNDYLIKEQIAKPL